MYGRRRREREDRGSVPPAVGAIQVRGKRRASKSRFRIA